jgi:hypothetical protein
MKIKTEVEVTDQMIEDQIVAALEGGSNYWYNLPDLSMLPESSDGEPTAIRITDAVLNHDVKIPVYDIEEDDELLGELSKESIQKALEIMSKDLSDLFSEILNEEGDAGTADVFFQLAVMGEIVFG